MPVLLFYSSWKRVIASPFLKYFLEEGHCQSFFLFFLEEGHCQSFFLFLLEDIHCQSFFLFLLEESHCQSFLKEGHCQPFFLFFLEECHCQSFLLLLEESHCQSFFILLGRESLPVLLFYFSWKRVIASPSCMAAIISWSRGLCLFVAGRPDNYPVQISLKFKNI